MKSPYSNKQLAILALIAVAIGFAVLNVGIRLMAIGFEPMTQVWLRLLVALILVIILFRRQIRPRAIASTKLRDWFWLFVMGTVGYSLGVAFVTLGALQAKLINVSVLTSTIPFFVFLYSLVLLRKSTRPRMLVFLLISFVGAAMVATHAFPPTLSNLGMGEIFVLLSAAAFAWYSVGRKLLSNHLNNSEITIIVMTIAFIASLFAAVAMGETFHVSALLNPAVLLGLAIGAGFNIVATQFENFAFQHLNAVVGSQILLIENAVAPLLGYTLYSEVAGPYEAIGAALVIAGVVGMTRMADS